MDAPMMICGEAWPAGDVSHGLPMLDGTTVITLSSMVQHDSLLLTCRSWRG